MVDGLPAGLFERLVTDILAESALADRLFLVDPRADLRISDGREGGTGFGGFGANPFVLAVELEPVGSEEWGDHPLVEGVGRGEAQASLDVLPVGPLAIRAIIAASRGERHQCDGETSLVVYKKMEKTIAASVKMKESSS